MVINCLPLYDPPPRTSAASENDATSPPPATTSSPASTSSSQARKRESKLKKARSEEILNKSNAPKPEKEDGGSKSDGEDVEEVKRKPSRQEWTRFSSSLKANYSTRIHDAVASAPTSAGPHDSNLDSSTSTSVEASSETDTGSGATGKSKSETFDDNFLDAQKAGRSDNVFAHVDPFQEGQDQKGLGDTTEIEGSLRDKVIDETYRQTLEQRSSSESTSSSEAKPNQDVHPSDDQHQKLQPRMAPEGDGGSDEEGSKSQGISVNYVDNPEDLKPQLKRSSGSVSFIGAVSVPPRQQSSPVGDKIEEGGEEEEGNIVPSNAVTSSGEQIVEEKLVESEDDNVTPPSAEAGKELPEHDKNSSKDETSTPPKLSEVSGAESSNAASPASSSEKPPLLQEASSLVSHLNTQPSAPFRPGQDPNIVPSPSSTAAPPCTLTPTSLPPSPVVTEPSYIERSGWLSKLSHKKGMFGDKWQKRYFVLHGSWLYYFKKYGVSHSILQQTSPRQLVCGKYVLYTLCSLKYMSW